MALATAITAAEADPKTAARIAESALTQLTALGQAWYTAEAANLVAVARLRIGDAQGARQAALEAAGWAQRIGHRGLVCQATFAAAVAERVLGGAAGDAHAALADAAALGLLPLVADGLEIVAALAADGGRTVVATRLGRAAGRLRVELGMVASPLVRLLDAAVEPACAEDALAWEAAVAYAGRSRGRRSRPRVGWESLTPTERDVVALATRGLTNAAIGAHLLITAGTVRTHLRSVFGKLGVTSRAELAAQAARRGL